MKGKAQHSRLEVGLGGWEWVPIKDLQARERSPQTMQMPESHNWLEVLLSILQCKIASWPSFTTDHSL